MMQVALGIFCCVQVADKLCKPKAIAQKTMRAGSSATGR